MNRDHLGDALDFWKGSIIRRLNAAHLLQNLAVIPMITDAPWNQNEITAYWDLLCLEDAKPILNAKILFGRIGNKYFKTEEVQDHVGDIFLDPDIGIVTNARRSRKHVTGAEIAGLLDARKLRSRVVMVYQHAAREQLENRLPQIAAYIRVAADHGNIRICGCCYAGQQVSMLFLSYDEKRIKAICRFFHELLKHDGPCKRRIHPFPE